LKKLMLKMALTQGQQCVSRARTNQSGREAYLR
jgi:hypothetical protein